MATFVKFTAAATTIGSGLIDFSSDTFKIALSNTAPTAATDDELADITQISAGNGYTAGGTAISNDSFSGGVYDGDDIVFTASGGSIGPWRYAVLYDDTSTGDKLLGYWDAGSSQTIADGGSTTLSFTGSIYTIA